MGERGERERGRKEEQEEGRQKKGTSGKSGPTQEQQCAFHHNAFADLVAKKGDLMGVSRGIAVSTHYRMRDNIGS